jgi:MoxR-like ATPase
MSVVDRSIGRDTTVALDEPRNYAASGHARLVPRRRSAPVPISPPQRSRTTNVAENQDLVTLIRASTPLLVIESSEETRVVEGFRHAIAQALRPLYRWSITDGLKRLDLDRDEETEDAPDASLMLQAIKRHPAPGVYLLLDFQPYLRYPMTLRLLREIVQRTDCAEHTIVLVGGAFELPAELAAVATRFAFELPDGDALAALLREEAFRYSRDHDGRRVVVDADAARAIVRNLKGLSFDDARRIVRKLIYDDGALTAADLPNLARAKYALLDRNGLLHFEYETAQFANVAGLGRLKLWIAQRRPAFLGEKLAAKLDPPKGVLLLGVQGCGKSLAAKAIAGGFGVPLLRLDIGTLYNKYQGETERNLRDALKNAELLAPCVLWIDEIEKALATAGADDGVSRRVLGYLLTWMAERKAPVFLVATANDVQALPAELLRKGRFDEVFFVDLPDAAVRGEIFRLHLVQRSLDLADYDIDALAGATAGFSGAEIEQLIVAALYAALAGRGKPTQAHLLTEVRNTRPLSVLMAERVAELRAWARERTVPAD